MISQPTPDLVIVLTTWPADRDAAALARPLVDERLAACVNVLPHLQSTYRWQAEVQTDVEQQLVIKTRRDCLAALHTRLVELHPYDVPEFIVVDIAAASTAYAAWLRDATTPDVREP